MGIHACHLNILMNIAKEEMCCEQEVGSVNGSKYIYGSVLKQSSLFNHSNHVNYLSRFVRIFYYFNPFLFFSRCEFLFLLLTKNEQFELPLPVSFSGSVSYGFFTLQIFNIITKERKKRREKKENET